MSLFSWLKRRKQPPKEVIPSFYRTPYGMRPLMATGQLVPRYYPAGSPPVVEHCRKCLHIAKTMVNDPEISYEQLDDHLRWSGIEHPSIRYAYQTAVKNIKHLEKTKPRLMFWFNSFYEA